MYRNFTTGIGGRDELKEEDRQKKAAEDRQQQVAAAIIARPGYGDMDRTSRFWIDLLLSRINFEI